MSGVRYLVHVRRFTKIMQHARARKRYSGVRMGNEYRCECAECPRKKITLEYTANYLARVILIPRESRYRPAAGKEGARVYFVNKDIKFAALEFRLSN